MKASPKLTHGSSVAIKPTYLTNNGKLVLNYPYYKFSQLNTLNVLYFLKYAVLNPLLLKYYSFGRTQYQALGGVAVHTHMVSGGECSNVFPAKVFNYSFAKKNYYNLRNF